METSEDFQCNYEEKFYYDYEENDYSDDEVETSDSFDDFFEKKGGKSLYEGAPITVSESVISILNLALEFPMSGALLSRIIDIIILHCKKPNNCVESLYIFKKIFEDSNHNIIKHFYCSTCYFKLKNKSDVCQKYTVKNQASSVNYFIEFPILGQLKSMFEKT